nr:glycogen synthase [Salmonella sp. NCTC 7297]
MRLNAVIWLKVWHAASGAAYRGLADTVSDSSLENLADGIASGFVFEDSNAWSLLRAIRRAFVLWSRPSLWRFVQRQAMAMDFSWQVAAKSYRELYYRLK